MTAIHNLFINNFLAPATATWNDIKIGTMRSFTKDDLTHSIWNIIVCTAPLIGGGVTASLMNKFTHEMIPRKIPLRRLVSVLSTTASVIVGAGVSFFVIKFLAANRITLDSFSADKTLKLEALSILPAAALSPLYLYFGLHRYLSFYPAFLPCFGVGAFAGYFGQRSLYVIGAISALSGAVQAAMATKLAWKYQDVRDRQQDSYNNEDSIDT